MAARNVKADVFDGLDKLPSATLKRNPKNMDLNKNDLLRLLGYLEGELQARDVTIAALKAEKAKQLLYQAKYGRFGLGDPFLALQRDSESQKDTSFDESAVKAMYDNQLAQLENLIETQRKAQHRNREQLAAVEKRYHKVLAELEEEKRKHAQDTEQGDNVTYMLEKERERLKQELDFEKAQVKKLEKEIKKHSGAGASKEGSENGSGDGIPATKHKQMVLLLVKERNKLIDKLCQLQLRNQQIEQTLKQEQDKTKNMAEGLASESQKSLAMEAELEKHLADCDTEREQIRLKLAREESKNRDLSAEVEHLRLQVEQFGRQLGRERPRSGSDITTSTPAFTGYGGPHRQPSPAHSGLGTVKTLKSTPPSTPPELRRTMLPPRETPDRDQKVVDSRVKSTIQQLGGSGGKSPDRTVANMPLERPVPAEKPPDLSARLVAAGSTSSSQQSTVFTTPSGTRISVAVGGGATVGRKPVPTPRGTPPPIPPNKPQVVLPTAIATSPVSNMQSQPPRFSSSPANVRPSLPITPVSQSPQLAKPRQQPLTQITVANDKITISREGAPRPVSVNANSANMFHSSTASVSGVTTARKPATQVCATAHYK